HRRNPARRSFDIGAPAAGRHGPLGPAWPEIPVRRGPASGRRHRRPPAIAESPGRDSRGTGRASGAHSRRAGRAEAPFSSIDADVFGGAVKIGGTGLSTGGYIVILC